MRYKEALTIYRQIFFTTLYLLDNCTNAILQNYKCNFICKNIISGLYSQMFPFDFCQTFKRDLIIQYFTFDQSWTLSYNLTFTSMKLFIAAKWMFQ